MFCTCKDSSIRFWYVTSWPLSMNVLHTHILFMSLFGQEKGICAYIRSSISKPLFKLVYLLLLYLMRASAWLTYWMYPEFHSCVNLEVSYIFHKVPTFLWSLVDVQTFLHYLYIFGFNLFWMVVNHLLHGLCLRFTETSIQAIISGEPLLYWNT